MFVEYNKFLLFIPALNSSTIFKTSNDDITQFLDCLDHHIKILDATVHMRKDFQEIVESQDNMRIVHLPTWAGLGAVQWVTESDYQLSRIIGYGLVKLCHRDHITVKPILSFVAFTMNSDYYEKYM